MDNAVYTAKNTEKFFAKKNIPSKNEVTGLTDNEIISLFNARNERALSAMSEKYGSNCSRIARNILKND